ncbi:MAG: microcin ABC transporter permease, partial [SAR324 cluster bacterium]|nr:microcin ABC transporter permease [SAR324 cluster bacterium]
MTAYIFRRLLLIIPTLFGILLINFAVIQVVPGGPVEQMIAQLQGDAISATDRFTSSGGELRESKPSGVGDSSVTSKYRGSRGLDPDIVKEIERMYGFDKPAYVRFFGMIQNYLAFDFGESLFRDRSVVELVIDKMPVSISLGIWSTLAVYLVCIPLGIRKALKHGSRFDVWSSTLVILGNAIPTFLFAILLIILFAGGEFFAWFP